MYSIVTELYLLRLQSFNTTPPKENSFEAHQVPRLPVSYIDSRLIKGYGSQA